MSSSPEQLKALCTDETWVGREACRRCGLGLNLEAFADSGVIADLNELLGPIEEQHVSPGDVLYQDGVTGDSMFTLRSGLAKAMQYLPDGSYRIVRLHNTGSMFGMERMLGLAYEHTVVAVNELAACRIPVQVVQRLSEEYPALYQGMLEHWHRHVQDADTWITEFSTGSVKARVARLVAYLARLQIERADDEVELLHGEEMAAIVGVTPESVSRVVAELKRREVLIPIREAGRDLFRYNLADIEQLAQDE